MFGKQSSCSRRSSHDFERSFLNVRRHLVESVERELALFTRPDSIEEIINANP